MNKAKKHMEFDEEELEILEALEKGKLVATNDNISLHQKYAKTSRARNKRINIRISERDLLLLKQRAMYEGLPYQTLITSILHKILHSDSPSSPSKEFSRA